MLAENQNPTRIRVIKMIFGYKCVIIEGYGQNFCMIYEGNTYGPAPWTGP